MSDPNFRSGYVALIGRPNAGKSTLLNYLVGEKIAAVSNKPQTTRHKIQGIVTDEKGQIVFVDTPGVHKPGFLLNRRMMAAVHDAILSVDLIVLLRDASVSTGNGDRFVLDLVKESGKKSILVLNKIDRVKREDLLALAAAANQKIDFTHTFMISAENGSGCDDVMDYLAKTLPEGPWYYPEDQISDAPTIEILEEIARKTRRHIEWGAAVLDRLCDSEPTRARRRARAEALRRQLIACGGATGELAPGSA